VGWWVSVAGLTLPIILAVIQLIANPEAAFPQWWTVSQLVWSIFLWLFTGLLHVFLIHHFIAFTWGMEIYTWIKLFHKSTGENILQAIENIGVHVDITKQMVEEEVKNLEEAIRVAVKLTQAAARDAKDWTEQAGKDTKEWTTNAGKDTKEWTEGAREDTSDWVKTAAGDVVDEFDKIGTIF
jgi:hypothetical protein